MENNNKSYVLFGFILGLSLIISTLVGAYAFYKIRSADYISTTGSTKKAVVCAVLTADCLPVLFSNAGGTVVAAAHAGWRGLASGILQETVKTMRESAGDEIFAWMGPAIGPAQFEVGVDVLEAFSQHYAAQCFIPGKTNGKYLADIYSLAKYALAQVGVFQVAGGEHCTFTEADKFYSYRRDGITGRMASVIWME